MARNKEDKKLTDQQEIYAQQVSKHGDLAAAYKVAYPKSDKLQHWQVYRHAYALFNKPHIQRRIKELHAPYTKIAFSVDRALIQAKEDREFAREMGNPSAAVSATQLMCKVAGYLIDRKISLISSIDGMTLEQLLEHERKLDEKIRQLEQLHTDTPARLIKHDEAVVGEFIPA